MMMTIAEMQYSVLVLVQVLVLVHNVLVFILELILAKSYALAAFLSATNFGCTVTYNLFRNVLVMHQYYSTRTRTSTRARNQCTRNISVMVMIGNNSNNDNCNKLLMLGESTTSIVRTSAGHTSSYTTSQLVTTQGFSHYVYPNLLNTV